MKIAIVFDCLSGITKLLALEIQNILENDVAYCGSLDNSVEADMYFVGSWTDKGNCLQKTVAYFGTAGY